MHRNCKSGEICPHDLQNIVPTNFFGTNVTDGQPKSMMRPALDCG